MVEECHANLSKRAIWLFVYVITDLKFASFSHDRSSRSSDYSRNFRVPLHTCRFYLQVHIVSHCLLFKVHFSSRRPSKGFVPSAARNGATFIYYHAFFVLSTTFFYFSFSGGPATRLPRDSFYTITPHEDIIKLC